MQTDNLDRMLILGTRKGLLLAAEWHLAEHHKAITTARNALAASRTEPNVNVRLSHQMMADTATASATRHLIFFHEFSQQADKYQLPPQTEEPSNG